MHIYHPLTCREREAKRSLFHWHNTIIEFMQGHTRSFRTGAWIMMWNKRACLLMKYKQLFGDGLLETPVISIDCLAMNSLIFQRWVLMVLIHCRPYLPSLRVTRRREGAILLSDGCCTVVKNTGPCWLNLKQLSSLANINELASQPQTTSQCIKAIKSAADKQSN